MAALDLTQTLRVVDSNGHPMLISLTDLAAAIGATVAGVPTGTEHQTSGATAPAGYLLAQGQLVSRTTYATLWAWVQANAPLVTDAGWVAGTTASYSQGDGSTTFRLPDLRGVFPRGAGANSKEVMATGAAFTGPAVGSVQQDMIQGHEHQYSLASSSNVGAGSGIPASAPIGYSSPNTGVPISDGTHGTPRVGAETRPVAAGRNWIIKT